MQPLNPFQQLMVQIGYTVVGYFHIKFTDKRYSYDDFARAIAVIREKQPNLQMCIQDGQLVESRLDSIPLKIDHFDSDCDTVGYDRAREISIDRNSLILSDTLVAVWVLLNNDEDEGYFIAALDHVICDASSVFFFASAVLGELETPGSAGSDQYPFVDWYDRLPENAQCELPEMTTELSMTCDSALEIPCEENADEHFTHVKLKLDHETTKTLLSKIKSHGTDVTVSSTWQAAASFAEAIFVLEREKKELPFRCQIMHIVETRPTLGLPNDYISTPVSMVASDVYHIESSLSFWDLARDIGVAISRGEASGEPIVRMREMRMDRCVSLMVNNYGKFEVPMAVDGGVVVNDSLPAVMKTRLSTMVNVYSLNGEMRVLLPFSGSHFNRKTIERLGLILIGVLNIALDKDVSFGELVKVFL